jgi:hypothetical protein
MALALASTNALADEIFPLSSTGSPLPAQKIISVLRIDGSEIVVKTIAGNEKKFNLASVQRLTVESDPSLSAAESAFVGGKWREAVDGYLRAIRSAETWKTQYAAPRLIAAAAKSNRFDAAVAGYVALSRVDAGSAARNKPALPGKDSAFLQEAATTLEAAVRSAAAAPQKQALLSLSLDVEMARGNVAGAERAVEQLLALIGDGPADPKLAGMVGDIRLGQARLAMQNKRYADVQTALTAAGPHLSEPRQQAEALYLKAQATGGMTRPDDSQAQLDVALAFMRVVAHFGSADGRPFVASSMLEAGASLERAGRAADARLLYDQLSAEFPDSAEAAEAAARSARLTQRP